MMPAHVFGAAVSWHSPLIRQLPNVIVLALNLEACGWNAPSVKKHRIPRLIKQMQHRMACSYESWMFEGYDRVVVLTDHDARSLKDLNPRTPTIVIPNGVDIEYFTPTGYEPDEPALLFTGNYDYAPNLMPHCA
jgi:glycosyltransferase involved in cell wall biosynthesis